jgi:hypothetical protein
VSFRHQPETECQRSRLIAGAIAVCESKKAYRTGGDAIRASFSLKAMFGTEYRRYRCDICDQWHLATAREGEPSVDFNQPLHVHGDAR